MEKSRLNSDESLNNQPHNLINAGLIVISLVSFIITAGFNGLAGSGAGVPTVFYSTVGNISDMFELYITPAGFTFTIWSIIYLWLAASLVMFTATIFLSTSYGRLYLSPAIMTPKVSITFSLNMMLNLAWIFLWDRSTQNTDLLIVAAVFLVLIATSNALVMILMARNITNNSKVFSRTSPLFWWGVAYRIVLNGLGIYTTWTVIASLVNLTTALVYAGEVDQKTSCIISLSLLVLIHTTWFCLENFLFDSYTRYLVTPYLVVIWASSGIRAKKLSDPSVPQEIQDFVLAIIIIASLTFALRIAIIIYRIIRKPLNKMNSVLSINESK